MSISVKDIAPEYNFEISGVSYIGNPKPNTVMYVGRKISDMLINLSSEKDILCFTDEDVDVPGEALEGNAVIRVKNPQLEYSKIALDLEEERSKAESEIGFELLNGSQISKNAKIGANAYIEPGCFIGHGVVLGNNAVILTGTVIKYALIGDGFLCNEGARIGINAFTMADNEDGNKVRIPSLGKVIIGDEVEIGANNTVSRGSVSDTIFKDHVKTDAMVHIGHDAVLEKNVEIAAGTIIGGFAIIGKNTFMGLNSTAKNRISIGENCFVGMGGAVMKSFPENVTIAGNPAKGIGIR